MTTSELVLRLLAALAFSGVVGLERQLSAKAAGMRTHILVGVGSALFTLISGYAFGATASNADRIAAQVVSGIGFIGGGAILKERGSIRGLTTAAGLWTAAALGMAAGAGLYRLGAAATLVVLVTLVALRRIEAHLPRHAREHWTLGVTLDLAIPGAAIHAALAPYCRTLRLTGLRREETTLLTFEVELARPGDLDAVTARLQAVGARAVTWQAAGNAEEGH